MGTFEPVTDAELARARNDRAFRHKLMSQSLEALLAGLQKLRSRTPSTPANAKESAKQIREGVELAVRLAEIIQDTTPAPSGR